MSGRPSEEAAPIRRVVLVGFMGAGKSAVGAALARELRWRFRDFDRELERRLGLTVARIFADFGEEIFREQEARVGLELLGMDRTVLASGGGWPVKTGRMEGLSDATLSIWLRVTAEEAVRRCREQSGVRPLLESEDPVATARKLLDERRGSYRKARWTVDGTADAPEALAKRLAHQIRTDPERPLRE